MSQNSDNSPDESRAQTCDWSRLLRVVGSNNEMAASIAKTFVNEIPTRIADIDQAIEVSDGVALHRAAHTLKSSLRMFGADRAVELVLELETAGKSNSFENATSQASELKTELIKVEQAIHEKWPC